MSKWYKWDGVDGVLFDEYKVTTSNKITMDSTSKECNHNNERDNKIGVVTGLKVIIKCGIKGIKCKLKQWLK